MIWKKEMGVPIAGTDARLAAWYNLTGLPELAFDHNLIVKDVLAMMKNGAK